MKTIVDVLIVTVVLCTVCSGSWVKGTVVSIVLLQKVIVRVTFVWGTSWQRPPTKVVPTNFIVEIVFLFANFSQKIRVVFWIEVKGI